MKREIGGIEALFLILASLLFLFAYAQLHPSMLEVGVATLAIAVAEPQLILMHELAHGFAAVRVTGRRARVRVGEPPFQRRFSVGRIDVEFAGHGIGGHCDIDRSVPVTGWGLLRITLAGPLANLAAAAALGALAYLYRDYSRLVCISIAAIALSSLIQGLLNLIPIGSDTKVSDGYTALGALACGLRKVVYTPPTPGSLTEDAKAAMQTAGVAAAGPVVRVEHLLLGLYGSGQGAAARILRDCGFRRPPFAGDGRPSPGTTLTPASRRVVERAGTLLSLRGDPLIDTQHLLLALAEVRDEAVDAALADAGVDRSELRRRALAALT